MTPSVLDPSMHPTTRKILIGAAITVGVLLLGVVGATTYFYRQATALPEWYDPDAPVAEAEELEVDPGAPLEWEPIGPKAPTGPRAASASPPDPTAAPQREKRPKRRVMKNFHLKAVAKDPVLKRATRSSRAEFHDGRLEAGAVLDMERIDRDSLSDDNRDFFDRAAKAFPPLRNEQVYLALEDEPVTRDGYLQLSGNPRVKIGNLSYSLDGAARRLGMSPKKLRAEIDTELRRLKVRDPRLPPAELDP